LLQEISDDELARLIAQVESQAGHPLSERVRRGSFLERRLGKLESKLKVPDQWEFDNRVVAKAVSNLSIEDLRLLREGAVRHAVGAAFRSEP
jgi:hypothetical protein